MEEACQDYLASVKKLDESQLQRLEEQLKTSKRMEKKGVQWMQNYVQYAPTEFLLVVQEVFVNYHLALEGCIV